MTGSLHSNRIGMGLRSAIGLFLAAGCLHPQTSADRMAWFQHDKLGMFIHFGPYSALAGRVEWPRIPYLEMDWLRRLGHLAPACQPDWQISCKNPLFRTA